MRKNRVIILGVGIGLFVGVVDFFLWGLIPGETFARTIWIAIHYPEFVALDCLAYLLSPGNADTVLAWWVLMNPLYWAAIGGLIAALYLWLATFRHPGSREPS
jgi:hypothetical protein